MWATIILAAVSLALGAGWNMAWPFSLLFAFLLCPIILAFTTVRLYQVCLFRSHVGLYILSVFLCEAARNLAYLRSGGYPYLIHDSETQLFVAVLAGADLAVGILAILAFRRLLPCKQLS